jgi:hypothetical protein
MTSRKHRSAVWAIINWAIIQEKVETATAMIPDQNSIEQAIDEIETDFSEEDLFLKEAKEVEELLITKLIGIMHKTNGKEIKRRITQRERDRKTKEQEGSENKVGVQIMPFGGNLNDLKDLGLDPEMLEKLSKSVMDQLFGQKRKKKSNNDDDDDDEEDDPGESFYM